MIEDVAFGDVFRYQWDYFVYFAESAEDDIIYAGKILDRADSNTLQRMARSGAKNGTDIDSVDMYSYVVLNTGSFKDRAVLCGVADYNGTLSVPEITLDSGDIENIKREILGRPGLTKLKELISLLS